MPMTDPTDALVSFQQALTAGQITLVRGELDKNIYVHSDRPNGELRLTYATLNGKVVTALVLFVNSDPLDGAPCFNLGYAVPDAFRNQGRAKALVLAAIAELRNGLSRNGITKFSVEAIIDASNVPSQRVAEHALSATATPITDSVSGLPALHYVKTIT
ncbi:MAG: GNAT family N-acetyltransferase [Hyphomonadaceae bacterium JAD_PAG50586_4]|nr:MAG: GNAT family N-acetyltransferase [Hyphomonadaceae bacterium JAD_PAG50586_4]